MKSDIISIICDDDKDNGIGDFLRALEAPTTFGSFEGGAKWGEFYWMVNDLL